MQCSQNGELAASRPTFLAGRKLTQLDQGRLWAALSEDSSRPSCRVLKGLEEGGTPLNVSLRHINRLRRNWGLSRAKGNPRTKGAVADSCKALVKMTPHVSFVGVHLFGAWMESHGIIGKVVMLLQQHIQSYAQAHPDADFPLLHHKQETLQRRFEALFYAPLLGIGKLSELDVTEHPLASLVGVGYHSSTLGQFLGQLERIDAGEALQEALIPDERGIVCYVDGHMSPYWSRKSMHKGKITMIGRIMPGSQAVIAHDENGHALCVQYHPPDIRMPHFIVDYCLKITEKTSTEVFVIDREVNSVELAAKFEENGLGLLSMLDSNEYHGLSSWTVTPIGSLIEDRSTVYEGQWAQPRPNDPRHFVLVQTGDKVLPYWGTSKVKEVLDPLEWPQVYRQRTHIQEYRFKEMKAHGALDVNYGTKTVSGPDRHQQRACEKLTQALDKAHEKALKKDALIENQQLKVAHSRERGHTTRLEQRRQKLEQLQQERHKAGQKEQKLTAKLDSWGEQSHREDRDFRKQTVMCVRTLLLRNALLAFIAALCASMQKHVSLECVLKLLFKRSGIGLETQCELTYWINTGGLSVAYKQTLQDLIAGINAMNLHCRGKPIRVRIKEAPT